MPAIENRIILRGNILLHWSSELLLHQINCNCSFVKTMGRTKPRNRLHLVSEPHFGSRMKTQSPLWTGATWAAAVTTICTKCASVHCFGSLTVVQRWLS